MKKRRKGLFGRLLAFWKEKEVTEMSDKIGFQDEKRILEKNFDSLGSVDVRNDVEKNISSLEKNGKREQTLQKTEQDFYAKSRRILQETQQREKKRMGTLSFLKKTGDIFWADGQADSHEKEIFFAGREKRGIHTDLLFGTQADKRMYDTEFMDTKGKREQPLYDGRIQFYEENIKPESTFLQKGIFREEIQKTQEGKKKQLFAQEEMTLPQKMTDFFWQEKPKQKETTQEVQPIPQTEGKEPMKRQEKHLVNPEADIEKLMQRISKKLWEERESCGRRLR